MSEAEIRVKRRTKYASIPNSVIRDTSISLEARGLLVYVMSCSEDWKFYRTQTMKILGLGRDRYQKFVRELKDARYLIVQPKQLPCGKLSGQEWVVFDEPYPLDGGEQAENVPQDDVESPSDREPENQAGGHREPEKPARRENPPAGKSGPLRKQTKKENKLTSIASDDAPPPDLDNSQIIDACSEYIAAHPRLLDETKTRETFLAVVQGDVNPADIVRAAKAFAHEQRGKDLQYVMGTVNFLSSGRWRQYIHKATGTKTAATLEERAAHWAESIRGGRYIPDGTIIGDVRMAIVRFGHFTDDELTERGFR